MIRAGGTNGGEVTQSKRLFGTINGKPDVISIGALVTSRVSEYEELCSEEFV